MNDIYIFDMSFLYDKGDDAEITHDSKYYSGLDNAKRAYEDILDRETDIFSLSLYKAEVCKDTGAIVRGELITSKFMEEMI